MSWTAYRNMFPPIPSAEARDRVQRALQEHPATAAAGIQVHDRDGPIELRGRVRDVETRTVASEVARGYVAPSRFAIDFVRKKAQSRRCRPLGMAMPGCTH